MGWSNWYLNSKNSIFIQLRIWTDNMMDLEYNEQPIKPSETTNGSLET